MWKNSHKPIIIGKGGSKLKKISQYARQDIEAFLQSKVYIRLWVKVKEEWRDNQSLLKELGYKIWNRTEINNIGSWFSVTI